MQTILEWLGTYKKSIDDHIIEFLSQKEKELLCVNKWGPDAIGRLKKFTTSGKTTRGGLIVFAYRMFGTTVTKTVLDAASAIELLHSGLLIHDDIMDEGSIRRGYDAIHVQYQKLSNNRIGRDMAICTGDLVFFLAFELLPKDIATFVFKELSTVASAQMQDAGVGHLDKHLTIEEIISLYTYKTARYSFSMPLTIGAILGGAPTSVRKRFYDIGQNIGILYQMRDDELGLSGNPDITGKPIGTDTKSGKQTVLSRLSKTALTSFAAKYRTLALSQIHALSIDSASRKKFLDLVDFAEQRSK
ncbi:polyprenyl synthetase family protein [Patescibacteria group bacterium]|nr:polyprenyl synthetase family protein [Patescibacteria group bacterium]MBU2460162.1 polyprenyl synthetase family protein [Patescibacteria group bacterium]MBU2543931.1 polyprenyl synthetase family protein [Patescibacteria group bacterium]